MLELWFFLNKRRTEENVLNVTNSDIEDWISGMTELKLNSKANFLNTVKSFYEFLLDRKYVNENPFKEIVEKINRKNRRKILRPMLSVQDVTKIIKASKNPRDRAIILTFYKTGMRANELAQLNINNIYWNERRIRIPKRKGRSPGDVYFDDECERALKLWISIRTSNGDNALFTNYRGERLKYDGIDSIVKETSIRSGVGKDTADTSEAITPHVFRYAFTTHLAGNRCHPKVIQMLRGDADSNMLDRYTQFTQEQVRQEYLRAIPKLGI
jgi:site-specific recombinase XerD